MFLPFAKIVELMEEADVVVCHGGVGSIVCALRAGHVPVTFPRLKRYSEIGDDHQLELAQALAARGTVTIAGTGSRVARGSGIFPPEDGCDRARRESARCGRSDSGTR